MSPESFRRLGRPEQDGASRRSSAERLGAGPPGVPLRPVRDTGMLLGERRVRRTRTRKRGGTAAAIAVVAILAVAGVTWAAAGPRQDPPASPAGEKSAKSIAYSMEVLPDPTPTFATYRSLRISLPILPEKVTAIAYHQASRPGALRMTSLVPDADMSTAAKGKVDLRPTIPEADGPEGVVPVLEGKVLRLWRSNRAGRPDTACDCGAKAGTVVYSPVSGRVAEIVRYKLYGRHPDYEIHITPNGWPEVDVVLIHVDALKVRAGDLVEAGASPVAEVRKLSDRVDHQLRLYTGDGGDHVHIQLNRVETPGKLQRVDGS